MANSKSFANVMLTIDFKEPIKSAEKEAIMFAVRDRVKSVLSSHDITEYQILFSCPKQ